MSGLHNVEACPVCRNGSVVPLLDLGNGPVFCNVQWSTREEARQAVRGPISLNSCIRCGHTFNAAFDSRLVAYAPGYENSQHFSAVFREYAERLVARLIARYDVKGQNVVDVGCGRGDLLALLCQRGGNRGFGFDPSFAGPVPEHGIDLRISREYFAAAHAAELQPRLVCCRHVLEHVEDPVAFLSSMRDALLQSKNAVLYLEVPNGEHLLRAGGLWDYLYEHVSHFSARSLEEAFLAAGFEVLQIHPDFGDQFLCAEARPRIGPRRSSYLSRPLDLKFERAAAGLRDKLAYWRSWSEQARAQGLPVSVWGAGSKGVMFLNLLGLDAPAPVDWIIDQNPGKHGRYVSGTAQRIDGPAALPGSGIETIVLMNEIYKDEIRAQLQAANLDVELLIA